MALLSALLLILLSTNVIGIGASANHYSYNLTITLANGETALNPTEAGSPYYYLLNQNLFVNNSLQSSVLNSVKLNGLLAEWHEYYDSDGNPLILIENANPLLPHQNASVELNFDLYLSKPSFNLSGITNLSEIPSDIREQYPLTGIWDLSKGNASEIISTAYSIKGDEENALGVIIRILDWFENNFIYSYDNDVPQDIWQTYRLKSGDCDDQAALFVMFCRILGIPSYTSIGPIYLPGHDYETDHNLIFDLTNVGWHGWAMVYLPNSDGGSWIPVDLTYFQNAFMDNGHIRSSDPIQHITGSALMYKDTAICFNLIARNYISESIEIHENLTNSDVLWIESHNMTLLSSKPETSNGNFYFILFSGLGLVALLAALFFIIRKKYQQHPPLAG